MVRGLIACLLVSLAGCDGAPCDAGALQSALDRAVSGDTVVAGACRIEGALVVPAGVTLRGQSGTVLAPGAQASIGVSTAAGITTGLRDLRIEVDSVRGVDVTGDGRAELSSLRFTVARGIAIYAEGVAELEVTDVEVDGPITAATRDSLPDRARIDQGASYGFVFDGVGREGAPARLRDVDLDEVGPWGGLVASSHLEWEGGSITDAVGTGLLVDGGDVRLVDVRIAGIRRGQQLFTPYALAAIAGARLTTDGLLVEDGDGIGVLTNEAEGRHASLTVRSQSRGGVRVQGGSAVIDGGSMLDENGLAGLLVLEGDVQASGLTIATTQERLALVGETTRASVADGVQLRDAVGRLADTMLVDNRRVGLLIELDAIQLADVVIDRVEVRADGAALGAIAQDASGPITGTWDAAISRGGSTAANDLAHSGVLPTVALTDARLPDNPLGEL